MGVEYMLLVHCRQANSILRQWYLPTVLPASYGSDAVPEPVWPETGSRPDCVLLSPTTAAFAEFAAFLMLSMLDLECSSQETQKSGVGERFMAIVRCVRLDGGVRVLVTVR